MDDLTLENFHEKTGFRFRVSKLQAARIALAALQPEARQALVGLEEGALADALNAYNSNGEPYNWVEEAVKLLQDWNESMQLTREEAFQEFLTSDGLANLQKRKHQQQEIPDSVYLEPGLTLENFSDRVEAAIGVRRRFRVSREQYRRIKDKELTREDALREIIETKRNEATTV